MDKLVYIFRRYDTDEDGKLEKREFNLFLAELGSRQLDEAQMGLCFSYIAGETDDCKLNLDQFLAGVPKLYACSFQPGGKKKKEKKEKKPKKFGKERELEDKMKLKAMLDSYATAMESQNVPHAVAAEKLIIEEGRLRKIMESRAKKDSESAW